MKAKRIYDFRGFEGPDASLEISLFEYGLAWKCANKRKQEYIFVYGIRASDKGEYDRFAYSTLSLADWKATVNEPWFKAESVGNYFERSAETLVKGFPESLHEGVIYHGTENIFGTCYHEGFAIV